MPLTTSQAPTGASPLWIIALFIALSEVTAGVASITTNGAVSLLFAIFAVTFPLGVFVTFVWLLIGHAPKLYSPGQYSEAITPEVYAAGVAGRSRAEIQVWGKAVADLLVAESEHGAEPAEGKRDALANQFEQVVVSSSLEVEVAALVPGRRPMLFPVDDATTVRQLLDELYFAMAPSVKPFQYLKTWVLESADGTVFDDIGTTWARRRGDAYDDRLLADVGIRPGDKLRVTQYSP